MIQKYEYYTGVMIFNILNHLVHFKNKSYHIINAFLSYTKFTNTVSILQWIKLFTLFLNSS